MFRPLRSLAAAALVALAALPAARADEKPALMTIVATAEPQTQLMAMVLSMQSLMQGAEVRVLLCGPGGDLALKAAPEAATAPQKPKGMSPQGLMQMLMAKGVTVEVCAIYLPNKGVGPDALLDGISPAQPPAIAGAMLRENVRLLTF